MSTRRYEEDLGPTCPELRREVGPDAHFWVSSA